MKEIILELSDAIEKLVPVEGESLHHAILNVTKKSSFVWRADYTIAIAKDASKTKVSNLMVCNELNEMPQTFKVKREQDFWKKLDAREDYIAVVECTTFLEDTNICDIETVARDVMRSRKEVHNVATLGFVWVVSIDSKVNLDTLFQLYFKESYISLEQDESKYYIGWTEKLKELDMRHFICAPTRKKKD